MVDDTPHRHLAALRATTVLLGGVVVVGAVWDRPALTTWHGPAATSATVAVAATVAALVTALPRPSERRRAVVGGVACILVAAGVLGVLVARPSEALRAAGLGAAPAALGAGLVLAAASVPAQRPGSMDALFASAAAASVVAWSAVGVLDHLVRIGGPPPAPVAVPSVVLVLLAAGVVWLRRPGRRQALGLVTLSVPLLAPLVVVAAAASGRDPDGTLLAWLVLGALAVTLRQVAAARRATAALADAMLASSPVATLLVAVDGTIARANASAGTLFGWSPEVLVGASVDRLVPHDRRSDHAANRRAFEEDADGPMGPVRAMADHRSVRAVRSDGTSFHADVFLSRVEVEGQPMVVATVRDVTDVVDHIAALEDLQSMQGLLLTTVTHDLRSPLTVIRGMASLLASGDATLPEATRADLAGRIMENAGKLDALITDLLDLERVRRGGDVAANAVGLDVAASHAASTAEQLGVTATVEGVRGLPAVLAEPAMLRRIVDNFIGNAAKYAPGHVEVRFHEQDGGVWLMVDDHGPGVPAEHRTAVFEAFERGAASGGEIRGTGVGLSLVREFAHRVGGRVLVTDRDDGQRGASFRVWLPTVATRANELRLADLETSQVG